MKHGRYSRLFPTALLARYEEALRDDDILNLNEEIALMTFRIGELVKGQMRGESAELWKTLHRACQSLRNAIDDGDLLEAEFKLTHLEQIIRDGVDMASTWTEVQMLTESKRRLVETQRKTLVDAEQMITIDRMMVLLSAVVHIIQTKVTDESTATAISAEIRQLVDVKASRPVEPLPESELMAIVAANEL